MSLKQSNPVGKAVAQCFEESGQGLEPGRLF